jgi:hypothetical protein
MILEGIVTTLSPDGTVNIAPMGPHVDGPLTLPSPATVAEEGRVKGQRFLLRPFPTSRTYQNLKAHGEGVLHVTDDVLLLARAALGPVEPLPSLIDATEVRGVILADACRYYEFRVRSLDDSEQRVRIEAEVVQAGRLRDFFGFNRAKHAVVEAAILATRTDFLPLEEIEAEYRKLAVLVDKTGGPQEQAAFALLREHVARVARSRSAGGAS